MQASKQAAFQAPPYGRTCLVAKQKFKVGLACLLLRGLLLVALVGLSHLYLCQFWNGDFYGQPAARVRGPGLPLITSFSARFGAYHSLIPGPLRFAGRLAQWQKNPLGAVG